MVTLGSSLALSYNIKPPSLLVTSILDMYTKETHTFLLTCASVSTASALVIKTRSNTTIYQQGTVKLWHGQTKQKQGSYALGIREMLNSLVRWGDEHGAGWKYPVPGGGLMGVHLKQINRQIRSWVEKGRNVWQFLFSWLSWPMTNNCICYVTSFHLLRFMRFPDLTDGWTSFANVPADTRVFFSS